MKDNKDEQKSNSSRDNYVAYCRYEGREEHRTINTCNSDDDGAFKVYRESELEKAYTEGQSYFECIRYGKITHVRYWPPPVLTEDEILRIYRNPDIIIERGKR